MQNSNHTKPRVAIYCRVAHGDESPNGGAIEAQRQLLRSFAKERGFSNCTEYADHAASGLTLDRPAFVKMCEDIRKGMLDVVLVKDLARIGRDIILVCRWLERMKKSGVDVISVQDGFLGNVGMSFKSTKCKRAGFDGPAA